MPFLPTDLSNLQLWLRGDSLNTPGSGSPIALWLDESANANSPAQAVVAQQPTVGEMNGLSCAHFAPAASGSAQLLDVPGTDATIPVSGKLTAFLVARNEPNAVYASGPNPQSGFPDPMPFGCTPPNFGGGWGFIGTYGSPQSGSIAIAQTNFGGEAPAVVFNWGAAPTVLAMTYDSYSQVLTAWKDGDLLGSDTGPFLATETTQLVSLGSSGPAGQDEFAFYGDIGEVVMYDRVLTSSELPIITKYLQQKWLYPSVVPEPLPALPTPTYTDVRNYWGDPGVPGMIRHQRKYTSEAMRAVGTPVLLKRMYTLEDVENGVAMISPTMDTSYGQPTHAQDQLSYGVGYVSVETQPGEWYDPATLELYISVMKPDPTYRPAPRYRGYGPGFLTYVILPDRPEDVWKLDARGAMIRQQQARVQLPWWPQVGDNDILITCRLDQNGLIAETFERYLLKMVTPITMRGEDHRGHREYPGMQESGSANASGNRFWVGQEAEMSKLPTNDVLYSISTDR
jgi:hypothetical protein